MSLVFDKLLGKGNYNYIGIEAPSFVLSKEAKDLLDDKIQFINYDFNKGVPDDIKNCNIFLSISVLEHIDEIDFFTEMYSTKVPEVSYHYHFVPTFLSVFNYLWHGCRHFNSLELRELLKYFNHEKTGIIYYGGFISLVFHMIFILLIDLISKIFKINYKFKLFNFNLVRGVVKIFENVDNFTAKMGIHTFCLLYWRSKK